ncbi:MAG: hypothetical protein NC407_10530 [Lachnoclostridium sp.]|nr:hypothetical protein [Lachnoclostridium sp.]
MAADKWNHRIGQDTTGRFEPFRCGFVVRKNDERCIVAGRIERMGTGKCRDEAG